MICWTDYPGGADFVSLALGYFLSGLQPLRIEIGTGEHVEGDETRAALSDLLVRVRLADRR